MARTDNYWNVGGNGSYIYTISPIGYDILINGSNRYLNFNAVSGSGGYGIRDNAGVIEYKNSGGAWTPISSGGGGGAVTSVFGRTGAVVAAIGDYTTAQVTEDPSFLYFTAGRAQAAITGGASTIVTSNLTANRALISNGAGKVAVSTVTDTELGYVSGVTSAIQTQLNAKLSVAVTSITGTANQVLANGTSGSAQTGAVTLSLPQNIATTSSPTFASLLLNGAGTGVKTLVAKGNSSNDANIFEVQSNGGSSLFAFDNVGALATSGTFTSWTDDPVDSTNKMVVFKMTPQVNLDPTGQPGGTSFSIFNFAPVFKLTQNLGASASTFFAFFNAATDATETHSMSSLNIRNFYITVSHRANVALNEMTGGAFRVLHQSAATITTTRGLYIRNTTNSGGGAITTNVGLEVDNQTVGGTNYAIKTNSGAIWFQGNTGLGVSTATAVLHIKAGTAAAGTGQVKLDAGTLLGTTEAGVLENNGTHLYFTFANGGTRYQLDQQSGSGTVTSVASADGSITVTSPTTAVDLAVVKAPKLTTARNIAITGDLAWNVNFDGSGNVTAAGTLSTVNANVGTFGSATQVAQFTVNAKGLITAASNITITPAASSITGGAALTKTDDTNVTLTLGGTPTTALLAATSLTLGWTGQLSLARGGTGASLSDPNVNSVMVWDDTTNAVRFAALSGLSYNSGTNTLTASGGSGLTVGTTAITSGSNTNILYNNSGVLGEYTITGTGTVVVMATSPTIITPAITTSATLTRTAIGVTSADGYIVQNTTAAAVGAQQYSPRIRLTGQGWKTTATAASQQSDWIVENQPVQGSTNPTSMLVFSSQINGGGYTPKVWFGSDNNNGDVITFSNQTAGGRTTMVMQTDGSDWELGARSATSSQFPNGFYIFDQANNYRLTIDSAGRFGFSRSGLASTAMLHLPAGTATAATAPIKKTAGPLNTTAEAGAEEFDGKVFTSTPVAGARGVSPSMMFGAIDSDFTLLSQTAAQPAFPTAYDVWTLQGSTSYFFEGQYLLNTGTTGHSVQMAFLLAGGATITSIAYTTYCSIPGAYNSAVATTNMSMVNSISLTNVTAATTAIAIKFVKFSGIIRMNAGGTVTPQIAFSVAPGGTNLMQKGSYIRFTPIGSDTVTAVGNVA